MFELWLLATAVVFTGVGFAMGKINDVNKITSAAIDTLIDQGYLRTRKNGLGQIEIVKVNDEQQ